VIINPRGKAMTLKEASAYFKTSFANDAVLSRRIAEPATYFIADIREELATFANQPPQALGIVSECDVTPALSFTQKIDDTVEYKRLDGDLGGDLSTAVAGGIRMTPGWIKVKAQLKVRCTPYQGAGWAGYAGFVQRIDDYERTIYVPEARDGSAYRKTHSSRPNWKCRDGGQNCLGPFYDRSSFSKIHREYTKHECTLFDSPGVQHTMASWAAPGIVQAIGFTTWFVITNEIRTQWLVLDVLRWRADFKLFTGGAGGEVRAGGLELLGRVGYSSYATLPLVANDPLALDVLDNEQPVYQRVGTADDVATDMGGWTTPPRQAVPTTATPRLLQPGRTATARPTQPSRTAHTPRTRTNTQQNTGGGG
jgi:hypothetical protein